MITEVKRVKFLNVKVQIFHLVMEMYVFLLKNSMNSINSLFQYIVKILMGPIDEWFDNLDEKPVSLDDHQKSSKITQSLENTHKSSRS